MSWKRAALYWLGFVILATYYRTVLDAERAQPKEAHRPFIDVAADGITTLDIERGGRHLHAERIEQGWRVTLGGGKSVPSDLINAVVDSLTSIPDVEVVAEAPSEVDDFGLKPPSATIVLGCRSAAQIPIRFGQLNPTGTAVYAQRGDSPRVYLVGRNLDYYLDLLLPLPEPNAMLERGSLASTSSTR
jgi:hypothetical protein